MIDKIKAEADAIPCGKDEKIKALEALLKLALKERDEALAYAERLHCALNQCVHVVEDTNYGWDGDCGVINKVCCIADGVLDEPPTASLAALKAEWQAEVVESFLHGLSSSDTINIQNRRPDARVEWFRKRAKEEGE